MLKSLRVQVIGAISLVLTLGLIGLLLMAGTQMTAKTLADFGHVREAAVLAIAVNIAQSAGELRSEEGRSPANQQSLQQRLADSAANLSLNLSILTLAGDVLGTTFPTPAEAPGQTPEVRAALSGSLGAAQRDGKLYIAAPLLGDERHILGYVWAVASLDPVYAELGSLWLGLVGASLASLALAGVVGWRLSARIIRPLTDVQHVAEEMAAGNFGVRAPVTETSQELAALGGAFNYMAQQVQTRITRERAFVANASHELRSPLAALKLRAESLVNGTAQGERAAQYIQEMDEEVTRLSTLVSELLHLSRLEGQTPTVPGAAIDVQAELRACLGMIRPRVQARKQHISWEIADNIPALHIRPTDLRTAVNNLLDNAVKYTHAEGNIRLRAWWDASLLHVEVSDTGEGIPTESLPHVTERFYRADKAHSRVIPGTGLGLSLVHAIATYYEGALQIMSSGVPGDGTRAELTLRCQSGENMAESLVRSHEL